MSLRQAVVGQFRKPQGFFGQFAGWIMARRQSNRDRNLWTLELLNIQPGDRILEFGCGPGIALEACLERCGEGHVIGLDHSQTMLDQARARNGAAIGDGRLELWLGTLDQPPAPPGLFDKVCSANVIQFLPDRAAGFRQIYALLKKNGVAATTYMPRARNPSRQQALTMAQDVKRHMQAAGFAHITIEELAMEPAPAVCILGARP